MINIWIVATDPQTLDRPKILQHSLIPVTVPATAPQLVKRNNHDRELKQEKAERNRTMFIASATTSQVNPPKAERKLFCLKQKGTE